MGSECQYCKTLIFKKKTKKMSKHYKVCPVKLSLDKANSQAFYCHNIHFYGDYRTLISNKNENEQKLDFDSKELIEKIKKFKSQMIEIDDCSADCSFERIRALYKQKHEKKMNLKHCKQIESLIFNLLKFNKFKLQKPTILELGAGKAAFGSMFHCFFNEESKLFLIDIASNFRNKEDNALKNVENVRRIQCGLQHCNISKIKGMNEELIVISKHLCGAATDFGLRSIVKLNVKTICIALCCRGKCSFETFCNVKYLETAIGICSKKEFDAIRTMSSWAIDGRRDDENSDHTQLGIMCRNLMDNARVHFLKQNGFKNVKLIKYIDSSVTKENVLLIASKE